MTKLSKKIQRTLNDTIKTAKQSANKFLHIKQDCDVLDLDSANKPVDQILTNLYKTYTIAVKTIYKALIHTLFVKAILNLPVDSSQSKSTQSISPVKSNIKNYLLRIPRSTL